jgi:hypothetical protein
MITGRLSSSAGWWWFPLIYGGLAVGALSFHCLFSHSFVLSPLSFRVYRIGYKKDAMGNEYVIYNGVRVIKGWPEQVEEAQLQPTVMIGGVEYKRIRYGEEEGDWSADRPCHDCAVVRGQYHAFGCDVEQCPACRGQALSCDCDYEGD